MRIEPEESYQDWAERVCRFETQRALKELKKGKSIDDVLESMSRRVTDKLLHPVYKAVRESYTVNHDFEHYRTEYYEKFLKYHAPVADHVDGNLFDNSQ